MEKDSFEKTLRHILTFLYGKEDSDLYTPRFVELTEQNIKQPPNPDVKLITHKDAFLISYGDMLSSLPEKAAKTALEQPGLNRLFRFLEKRNKGIFSYLHILPFHPYSSDDGFSVIDYRQVDKRFGSWEDIERLKTLPCAEENLKLAFDFVINHGSVQSSWFKAFLKDKEPYRSWYITRPENYDYRSVTRPRTHPLLTPFTKESGETVWVWTTFSADQVDYDFSNPDVLLEFTGILLEYYKRGARIVRLDAIAYLWKEDKSPCVHHPKTHAVVKFFRFIVDYLGISLIILTETNVPHKENVSYFGTAVSENDSFLNSLPEAHIVYNFALPPLTLYAALSGDASPLRNWAKTLPPPSSEAPRYFLNFLASHDGVGLTPALGLVDEGRFSRALEEARRRGALLSYKATPQGEVPYELNCSYASVVAPPALGPVEIRARAFLAVHGALLSLSGLSALYFHSWTGSEAWTEGPELLGYNRAINREKPDIDRVEKELDDPESFRFHVHRLLNLFLLFRKEECVFDPDVVQVPLESEETENAQPDTNANSVFCLMRGPSEDGHYALCIENLSNNKAVWKNNTVPREISELHLDRWETRWIIWNKDGILRTISSV